MGTGAEPVSFWVKFLGWELTKFSSQLFKLEIYRCIDLQAIVCEAVHLDGLVRRLHASIQGHVDRVVASEAVAPYVSTGPECDFATRWTPVGYMVRV